MIDKIEILQHGECRDFGSHSSEKSTRLLRIVAYRHELVTQLGKDCFNSLSEPSVCPRRRPPILLVQPIRHLKGNVRRLKEIQLHRRAEISLVPKDHAVVILPLHIFQVMQVMDVCCSHIKRMYHPAYSAQSVELISVIMHILRSTISPCGSTIDISFSHGTAVGTGILTDFHGLGVDTEYELSAIDGTGNGLADMLAKLLGQLATLIELATSNQVGNGVRTLLVQTIEQVILAINTESLGCDGQSHHFQVGKGGNNASARYISLLVYLISCTFLAYLKNVSELCNEVVHTYDDST